MRARHRLSKLLLRHGLVYEGSAWTLAHDAWLRRQRFGRGPLALAFDESYAAVLQTKTRRRRAARLPAWRLDPYRTRAHRRARRLGALQAAVTRPLPRPDAERGLHRRAPTARRDEDRQHTRTPAAGRGCLAPAPAAARECSTRAPAAGTPGAGAGPRRRKRPPSARALARPRGSREAAHGRRGRGRARARRSLLGTGDDEVARSPQRPGEESAPAKDARSDPRHSYEQPFGDARL